jgi:hypothetical protein
MDNVKQHVRSGKMIVAAHAIMDCAVEIGALAKTRCRDADAPRWSAGITRHSPTCGGTPCG